MSKEILCYNGFTLLPTVIGLENFPPLSQPIRCDLVTCVFPRFAQFSSHWLIVMAVVQTLVKSKAHDRPDEEIGEKNWC